MSQRNALLIALELQEEIRKRKVTVLRAEEIAVRYGISMSTARDVIKELIELCSLATSCCAKNNRGEVVFVNLSKLLYEEGGQ